MPVDPDVRLLFESQHNLLSEKLDNKLNKLERALTLSNENSAKLVRECSELKEKVVVAEAEAKEARDEVKALKAEMAVNKAAADKALADHKIESAKAIKAAVAKAVEEQKAVISKLRIDLDDLEQYGRRKSVRIQNVRVVPDEYEDKNQDLLLGSVNDRLAPSGIKLAHEDITRFHRSSAAKDDKDVEGGKVSQVIVKLRNWKLRVQFQGLNKLMREKEDRDKVPGCRVYNDLTKRRLALLNEARDLCINGWYAYADMNSNLKVRKGKQFYSFNTSEELSELEGKML